LVSVVVVEVSIRGSDLFDLRICLMALAPLVLRVSTGIVEVVEVVDVG